MKVRIQSKLRFPSCTLVSFVVIDFAANQNSELCRRLGVIPKCS